jgi:carboxylate-amine ligase
MSASNRPPAFSVVGIELEYMLVDTATLDCLPIAERLLRSAEGDVVNQVACADLAWSNEFFRHVIELKNPEPSADLSRLQQACQFAVSALNRRLTRYHACLMPGAMHPWMNPATDAQRWQHGDTAIYDAYARIFDCNTHGWANLQSMHINLPFADDTQFARVHAAVRLVLPLIPALAASSPVADAKPTGFADYRLEAYRTNAGRFPSIVGQVIPEPVASEAAYRADVLAPMYRDIAAADPLRILQHDWLNSRGAIARFDRHAIEIRLTDTQECVPADLAIATAIVQAVKHWYVRPPSMTIATGVLETILRRCIKSGERAVVDDAGYLGSIGVSSGARSAGEIWRRLIADIAEEPLPASAGWAQTLAFILENGTLSSRILQTLGSDFSRTNLRNVYRRLCECLNHGRMFTAGSSQK